MRRGRPVRGKVVQVDTRLSVTAAKADEWVPVTPGTDGALALGIAHVILTEGHWDREFVGDFVERGKRFVSGMELKAEFFQERGTFGLIDWWNNVLKDLPPRRAAEIPGVSEERIVRLAREFAAVKPAIASGERGAGA